MDLRYFLRCSNNEFAASLLAGLVTLATWGWLAKRDVSEWGFNPGRATAPGETRSGETVETSLQGT